MFSSNGLTGLMANLIFLPTIRHTSVEIQRMEALSRAPIFSHLAETINGVSSIRAYQKQDTFIRQNMQKTDTNASKVCFNILFIDCLAFFFEILRSMVRISFRYVR